MAKILYLTRCTVCKKRIKDKEPYTMWEEEYYCEPCFDKYMEIVDPDNFLTNENKNDDEQREEYRKRQCDAWIPSNFKNGNHFQFFLRVDLTSFLSFDS